MTLSLEQISRARWVDLVRLAKTLGVKPLPIFVWREIERRRAHDAVIRSRHALAQGTAG